MSGNPGGRPKGIAALVRDETREGAELVEFMLRVLRGGRYKVAYRMQAAQWLADRGFGKPVVPVDATVSASVDATVTHLDALRTHLTDDDAERIARRLLEP